MFTLLLACAEPPAEDRGDSAEIQSLVDAVATLEARIAVLEADNADLLSDLDALTAEVAALRDDSAATDAALDARLTALELEIASLAAADADLQAQIDALPGGTRWYDDVVFSGQASNLWTTLDLGPWTESRRALVVLRGASRPPYGEILAYFRPLGLTTTPLDESGQLDTAYESEDYVLVETDDFGRIEWLEVNNMQLELRVRAVIL
jgi:hypothetical protein